MRYFLLLKNVVIFPTRLFITEMTHHSFLTLSEPDIFREENIATWFGGTAPGEISIILSEAHLAIFAGLGLTLSPAHEKTSN